MAKEGVIKDFRPIAETTVGTITKTVSGTELGLNIGISIKIDIPFEDAAFAGKGINVNERVAFDESTINGLLLASNLRKLN